MQGQVYKLGEAEWESISKHQSDIWNRSRRPSLAQRVLASSYIVVELLNKAEAANRRYDHHVIEYRYFMPISALHQVACMPHRMIRYVFPLLFVIYIGTINNHMVLIPRYAYMYSPDTYIFLTHHHCPVGEIYTIPIEQFVSWTDSNWATNSNIYI